MIAGWATHPLRQVMFFFVCRFAFRAMTAKLPCLDGKTKIPVWGGAHDTPYHMKEFCFVPFDCSLAVEAPAPTDSQSNLRSSTGESTQKEFDFTEDEEKNKATVW